MPKGILCLCVTCTQALSEPGKSSPLPAGCPQPARALLALVAQAHDIGGPAHPAIPSARLCSYLNLGLRTPVSLGLEEGGSQNEFELQPDLGVTLAAGGRR